MTLAAQNGKSPRRRTITPISPRLDNKLGMYMAAAGAAGVGLTALTNTAQAKVVYTAANTTIILPSCVPIDFNGDGVTDVNVCLGFGDKSAQLFASAPTGNGIRVKSNLAVAGVSGIPVGPGEKFAGSFPPMYYKIFGYYGNASSYQWVGPWANVRDRYLGVKFSISGTTHFGWVRLSTFKTKYPLISGYAYETIPNVSIKDGAGADQVAASQSRLPGQPQPSSLGSLAQGASGIAIWRREEE